MGGLVAGKKEDKLGMRASETTEVILQNCRVAATQLIGEEGQGFIQTLQVLDAGRIGIAALSVGLAQGAFEAAARYTAERKQFGRAISSFPSIQERLAQHQSQVEAARLLTYQRGVAEGSGPADDARVGDGEAVLERDCRPRRRRLGPAARRLWLREGLPG